MSKLQPSLILSLALVLVTTAAHAATSVSQFGITWFFDRDYPIGQFANGDYWVKGPVTITNISPGCITTNGVTVNGAQINPIGHSLDNVANMLQGYDSRMYIGNGGVSYSDTLNVANNLPLTLATNCSLISAISRAGQYSYQQLDTVACLTVLTSAPAAGAFRPPYMGITKFLFHTNQLQWGRLQALPAVTNTPALASVESKFARMWLEQTSGSWDQSLHPLMNQGNYSAYNALDIQNALLLLQLNYTRAQKETLLIRLVQLGIDNYGSVRSGAVFMDVEGLQVGMKPPVVFAALMLNDADMLAWADNGTHPFVFCEDRQHFYIRQSDVGRALNTTYLPQRVYTPYIQADVGLAESGGQHTSCPDFDGRNWDRSYRQINEYSTIGSVLALRLMNGVAAWNNQAVFDYADRYYTTEESYKFVLESSHVIPLFVRGMWENYRYTLTAVDTTAPILTGVVTSGLSSNSIEVVWTSNEPADGQVEYGVTTSFGLSNALASVMMTAHRSTLQNLNPETHYYFRVRSRDAAGNLAVSTNFTFTTRTAGLTNASSPLAVLSVTASSDDGNVPANTLDGSLATRWSADGDGQWIDNDLGSDQYRVDYALIAFANGDARSATFDIQVGRIRGVWDQVFHGTSSGTTLLPERYDTSVDFGPPGTAGRYVRIVGHQNSVNTWNSITEVSFFGRTITRGERVTGLHPEDSIR